jgi:methionine salvage enolase-phosphatase E1
MPTKRQVEAYHKKLCRQLGIQPGNILMIDDDWQALEGMMGAYSHGLHTLFIRKDNFVEGTRNFKGRGWRWIVAHETYHHYQNSIGWLTRTHYRGTIKRYWKRRLPYSAWPWERAAEFYAKKVTE